MTSLTYNRCAKLASCFNHNLKTSFFTFQFCSEVEVSNNLFYPTFARTKPTDSQISKSVVSILKQLNWKKVAFVHTSESVLQHTADTIYQVNVYLQHKYKKVNNLQNVQNTGYLNTMQSKVIL